MPTRRPPGQGFRKSHPKRTRFTPPRLDSSHAQKALSELTNFSDRLRHLRLFGLLEMTPASVNGLSPAFFCVPGEHPLKRQLRLLHAQALQRFPPEEVCGGRSLLIFRRGHDAMDE